MKRTSQGVALVEIVIVAAIVGTVFVAIAQVMILSVRPIGASTSQTEAIFLAEEAIEAVRVMRNESWSTNIDSLANGTTYYPVVTAGNWTLSTAPPGPINNLFTRTVVLSAVDRDTNDDIIDVGTLDTGTRKITATVAWTERTRNYSIVIDAYITDFLGN